MTSRILVVPYRPELLERLPGRCVVVCVDRLEDISRAAADAQRLQVLLHCVKVRLSAPLASIPFQEAWRAVPLALFVPSLGRVRDLAKLLPVVRLLNLRVYLPAGRAESFTAIRILSSLGVETAVDFFDDPPLWELASDLAGYALLGLAPRAPIEPFQLLSTQYRPDGATDFGAVYFDDPSRYLHLDESGRVAVSAAELAAGRFLAEDAALPEKPEDAPGYSTYVNRWRSIFLEPDGCAYCEGWRVCRGRYASQARHDQSCRGFFSELMDLVEQKQALKTGEKVTWRP